MKSKLFACVTVMAGFALALGLSEGLLRLIEKRDPEFNRILLYDLYHKKSGEKFLYDPLLGWKNIPGLEFVTYGKKGKINSKGLRSPEYSYKKEAGSSRVLVLGDSFAWGFGVSDEELFSRVLEKKLREKNPRVEVINGGVSGWGTDQELLFLEEEGYKYSPDKVVLMFFLWNDLWNNIAANQYMLEKPYFKKMEDGTLQVQHVPVPKSNAYNGLVQTGWLFEKSALLRTVVIRTWNSRFLRLFDWLGCLEIKKRTQPTFQESVPLTVALIKKMDKKVKSLHSKLIVVKFGRFLRELEGYEPEKELEFEKQLLKVLPQIHYLDLDDELEKLGISNEALIEGGTDGHWNPFGHREVGKVLARVLEGS